MKWKCYKRFLIIVKLFGAGGPIKGAIIHTKSNVAGFQGNRGLRPLDSPKELMIEPRKKKKKEFNQHHSEAGNQTRDVIPEDEYPQHAPKLTHISEPSTPSGHKLLQGSTSRQLNDTLVGDLAYKRKRLISGESDTSKLSTATPMQTITRIRNATSVFNVTLRDLGGKERRVYFLQKL